MLRVDRIRLSVPEKKGELVMKLERALQLKKIFKGGPTPRYSFYILRKSLDARRKPELFYVYTIAVSFDEETEKLIISRSSNKNISLYEKTEYDPCIKGAVNNKKSRPIIAGSGPAGLFAAYILSINGYAPIVLERGEKVDDRLKTVTGFFNGDRLDTESNVQFGEGGAGTFSDGKLNTGVNDRSSRNGFVLKTFVKFGAPEEIAYVNKPHIGTDKLVNVIRNMRNEIIRMGGSFFFSTRLEKIHLKKGCLCGVTVKDNLSKETSYYDTDCLVIAIGHSARDTFKMLSDSGLIMTDKPFAVGLRIQHPQSVINRSMYGRESIPGIKAADYKMTYRSKGGRNVYSFCMCPGGYVVNASSEEGRLCINGMSYSGRNSENANSAIVVAVDRKDTGGDGIFAGLEYQRRVEEAAYTKGEGLVPVQLLADFKTGTPSKCQGSITPLIKGDYRFTDLRSILSEEINKAIIESIEHFGYTCEGFDMDDAILAGVEARTSSPVRIIRDDGYEGSIKGIFPCGEGAGYAGGITSAAIDGIKTAEAVMQKYGDDSQKEGSE